MLIVFIRSKRFLKGKERSLDLVLRYLINHPKVNSNRWLEFGEERVRIGRTSFDFVVLPMLEEINQAIAKYLPEFKAFEIKKEPYRRGKYHKEIIKNPKLVIKEDDRHFYLEIYSEKEPAEGEEDNINMTKATDKASSKQSD